MYVILASFLRYNSNQDIILITGGVNTGTGDWGGLGWAGTDLESIKTPTMANNRNQTSSNVTL